MTRYVLAALSALACGAAVVALRRTFLLPWDLRTPALTETERRRAAWGGLPVGYRRTQEPHCWKLRLARRLLWRGRRSA